MSELTVGKIRTVKLICKERTCDFCGEPATWKLTFLYPNSRTNPKSKAYGKDDCSWCEDDSRFVCNVHEKDRYRIADELRMNWCSAYPRQNFKHLFLYEEEVK